MTIADQDAHAITPKKGSWEAWYNVFLAELAESGMVKRACEVAGIARRTAYTHRDKRKKFRAAWDEALQVAISTLEDEAWRRARDGVTEPVYQGGKLVGTVQKYSDTLLIFLLKAHNPERYRDRYDVTSKGEKIATTPQIVIYLPHNQRDALPPAASAPDDSQAGTMP